MVTCPFGDTDNVNPNSIFGTALTISSKITCNQTVNYLKSLNRSVEYYCANNPIMQVYCCQTCIGIIFKALNHILKLISRFKLTTSSLVGTKTRFVPVIRLTFVPIFPMCASVHVGAVLPIRRAYPYRFDAATRRSCVRTAAVVRTLE